MICDDSEWLTISETRVTVILVLIIAILNAVHHAHEPIRRSGSVHCQVIENTDTVILILVINGKVFTVSDTVNLPVLSNKVWIHRDIFETIVDVLVSHF